MTELHIPESPVNIESVTDQPVLHFRPEASDEPTPIDKVHGVKTNLITDESQPPTLIAGEEADQPEPEDFYDTIVAAALEHQQAEHTRQTEETSEYISLLNGLEEDDEIAPIDSIRQQEQDIPLDESLVLVAKFLKNKEPETEKDQELVDILSEIEQLLPDLAQVEDLTELMTPELAEKIIMLLESLGYPNQHAELMDYISEHGLKNFIKILETLCILSSKNNWHEDVTQNIVNNDEEITKEHIAKMLFKIASSKLAVAA